MLWALVPSWLSVGHCPPCTWAMVAFPCFDGHTRTVLPQRFALLSSAWEPIPPLVPLTTCFSFFNSELCSTFQSCPSLLPFQLLICALLILIILDNYLCIVFLPRLTENSVWGWTIRLRIVNAYFRDPPKPLEVWGADGLFAWPNFSQSFEASSRPICACVKSSFNKNPAKSV